MSGVWLCPGCHGVLDRGQQISVDLTAETDPRRCAACGTPRLQAVADTGGHAEFVTWWGDPDGDGAGMVVKQCTSCEWVGVRDSEAGAVRAAAKHTEETSRP